MEIEGNFVLGMGENKEGYFLKSSNLTATILETGSVRLDHGKPFTFVHIDDEEIPTLRTQRESSFLPWNRVIYWGIEAKYGAYFVYVEYEGALHTNNQGQWRKYIGEVRFKDIDQAKGLVAKLNNALHETKSEAESWR